MTNQHSFRFSQIPEWVVLHPHLSDAVGALTTLEPTEDGLSALFQLEWFSPEHKATLAGQQ